MVLLYLHISGLILPDAFNDTSDQLSDLAEEPSRLPPTKSKKHCHKKHDIDPSTASDQYSVMNLGLHLLDQRNILTKQNTNPGPDTCLLQRRISPL